MEILKKLNWHFFGPSKPVTQDIHQSPVSKIFPLSTPLPPDEENGWKRYPLFKRKIKERYTLSAHASVLVPGHSPHLPHAHAEEEILVMLAGEADLLLPEVSSGGHKGKRRAKAGDFVYYPAGFPHSLKAIGEVPANYLMFKWSGKQAGEATPLGFIFIDNISSFREEPSPENFSHRRIFEGPTTCLHRLQCHLSQLPPGKGYPSHTDPYDVAILVLEGEIETLNSRIKPHGVIFCAAGEPHGMYNPNLTTAIYLVFEFHFDNKTGKKK